MLGTVSARRLTPADRAWVETLLTTEEFAVWATLGRADRAESLAVARRAAAALGAGADPVHVAAALLHDVGKADADLGALGRAAATIAAGVVGHDRARRYSNRLGRYVAHDDRGAARLAAAGARPEAVAWARAHHRRHLWRETGIPAEVCEVLAHADGER
jgi:hypothetical protein